MDPGAALIVKRLNELFDIYPPVSGPDSPAPSPGRTPPSG
jgi:hypothetical protein